jgi:hypothetical protein
MTTKEEVKPDAELLLDKGQTAILWGLLDAPTMGTPFKNAEAAGKLFKAVRAAAVHHGILSE